MRLSGKTRREIETALSDKSRAELLDVIHSLVTFERLLTAREIAEASHVDKRTVLADMHAGRFEDQIFGAGFFCRGSKSFRVSASAANRWRESFFVRVRDALPSHKKDSQPDAIAAEKNNAPQNGVTRKNFQQKAGACPQLAQGVL